jgi:hypothetical protein
LDRINHIVAVEINNGRSWSAEELVGLHVVRPDGAVFAAQRPSFVGTACDKRIAATVVSFPGRASGGASRHCEEEGVLFVWLRMTNVLTANPPYH